MLGLRCDGLREEARRVGPRLEAGLVIERWHRTGEDWRLSFWAPARREWWRFFRVGWACERHPREWNVEILLGPVSVSLWRSLP